METILVFKVQYSYYRYQHSTFSHLKFRSGWNHENKDIFLFHLTIIIIDFLPG